MAPKPLISFTSMDFLKSSRKRDFDNNKSYFDSEKHAWIELRETFPRRQIARSESASNSPWDSRSSVLRTSINLSLNPSIENSKVPMTSLSERSILPCD